MDQICHPNPLNVAVVSVVLHLSKEVTDLDFPYQRPRAVRCEFQVGPHAITES